jgi:hypothetical protein
LAALSRRRFLSHAPLVGAAGLVAAGGLGAVRGLFTSGHSAPAAGEGLAPLGENVIVHVRNFATGEISIMAGTSEVVYRDADVVARLLQGAQRARSASGLG